MRKTFLRCESGTPIYLVDGASLRDKVADFTFGGHWLVYKNIPAGEVWIDEMLQDRDREATIVHEVVEIKQMLDGLSYEEAHAIAEKEEAAWRAASSFSWSPGYYLKRMFSGFSGSAMMKGKVVDFLAQMVTFREHGRGLGMGPTRKPKGIVYWGVEDFVLQNGIQFTKFTKKNVKRGTMKECYRNAYLASLHNKTLVYVEGYAIPANVPLPLAHAWCVDMEGHIHEVTWPEKGLDYFGVPFDFKYLTKAILKRKMYGIIDNWEYGFPLLKIKDKTKFMHNRFHS